MNDQPVPVQRDDSTLAVVCHLLGLALLTGIPFANVLAPLALWLWKRDENPTVNEHGKEALNFQLSMSIYTIVAGVSLLLFVGIILLPLVLIVNIVCTIIAAIKAGNGEFYRYPVTIRFLK